MLLSLSWVCCDGLRALFSSTRVRGVFSHHVVLPLPRLPQCCQQYVVELPVLMSERVCVSCLVWLFQVIDERDKSDKLWELLTTLHENPPKADHGKTVSKKQPPA